MVAYSGRAQEIRIPLMPGGVAGGELHRGRVVLLCGGPVPLVEVGDEAEGSVDLSERGV